MLILGILGLLSVGLLLVPDESPSTGEDGENELEHRDQDEEPDDLEKPDLIFDLLAGPSLENVPSVQLDAETQSYEVDPDGETVLGSQASETIDLGNASAGLVFAGDGDIVLGSDVAAEHGQVGVVLDGDAGMFEGGDADEKVWIRSGVDVFAAGNGGNDFIVSEGYNSKLSGGDGNDTIVAFGLDSWTESEGTWVGKTDDDSDIVDGGEGNDLLIVGTDDIISSGTGEDTVKSYGAGVQITDFDRETDTLEVHFESEKAKTNLKNFAETWLSIDEHDGATRVFLEGESLITIDQNTNIDFLLRHDDEIVVWKNGSWELLEGSQDLTAMPQLILS